MTQTLHAVDALMGPVALPADKSIAHRSAMMAALGDGPSELIDYSTAADPQSTLGVLRQLGIQIETVTAGGTQLIVHGQGLHGLSAPNEPLDCGNSGTTMRLMAGILAGQPFASTLVGDASLNRRPMERIAHPLRLMQASLRLTDGHAPMHINGTRGLRGIEYVLPVASAQVKSCVLLAGLYAEGETTVVESRPSRDHTERMLGLPVQDRDGKRYLKVRPGHPIPARSYTIPRDFSAAAFFLVAGSIVPEGEVHLVNVGLNPTRCAFLHVLRDMGADITIDRERTLGGEPVGDLRVRPAALRGLTVAPDLVPNLIDEIPILAVAAACAEGQTLIREARELRVKETDRIDAMVKNLRALGAEVEEFEDGLAVTGGKALQGATVDSYDDHRIAMAMGIAALVAAGETRILNAECAGVSFADFWDELRALSNQPIRL